MCRWSWTDIVDKFIFQSADHRERFCEYALIAHKKSTKKVTLPQKGYSYL
jgi:hypothetical protein